MLVKSTLLSLPVYHMQATLLLPKTIKSMEQIMRRFLWNKVGHGNYYAQIGWKTICLPKKNGGLGIKQFTHWNKAFLLKLLWICYQKQDQPWVHLIAAKYLHNTSIELAESNVHYSPFWKSLLTCSDKFFDNICIHIGEGANTSFWYDKWLPMGPLAKQIESEPPN